MQLGGDFDNDGRPDPIMKISRADGRAWLLEPPNLLQTHDLVMKTIKTIIPSDLLFSALLVHNFLTSTRAAETIPIPVKRAIRSLKTRAIDGAGSVGLTNLTAESRNISSLQVREAPMS